MSLHPKIELSIKRHPILTRIDPEFVVSNGIQVSLERGHVLFRAGEPADSVFFLLDGFLQIEAPKPGQTRGRAVALVPAPGIVGDNQTVWNRPWSGSGVSLCPIQMIQFSRQSYLTLLNRFPKVATYLYCDLMWQYFGAIERRKHFLESQPTESIHRYLRDVCTLHGVGVGQWLKIKHDDIATSCGLRRETVVRSLKELKERHGVETARGRIQFQHDFFELENPMPSLISPMSDLRRLEEHLDSTL